MKRNLRMPTERDALSYVRTNNAYKISIMHYADANGIKYHELRLMVKKNRQENE